jgi:DNA invertase Pin-like site-specific DNA recombinase
MTTNKSNVNQKYGYVRVSSKSQELNSSLESQKKELIRQGIPKSNLRVEIGSAADGIKNRHVFQKLIEEELQKNDLLMVTKIDRCSRNTLEFLKLQDNLFQRSITFVALDIPHSNDLATNKLIATSLSAIAAFENDRLKERQRQEILAAKKAGKYKGRKTVINKKLIDEVKGLKENSNLSVTQIAKLTEKSRATIYKVLKEELGYISNRLVKPEKINEPK